MITRPSPGLAPCHVVADIGGTNARFATHSVDESGVIHHRDLAQFRCREFGSLSEVLDTYLQQTGKKAEGACISIAGPADAEEIRMTNLDWAFSVNDFKKLHGLKKLWVINDATAAALATTRAESSQLQPIKGGQVEEHAARINLIPGTGFGMGTILPYNGDWIPLQGEGGHATLAAVTDEEFAVLRQITARFGRAINDVVLSGPGMLNIYQALASVRGEPAQAVDAPELTRRALQREDELSADCLDIYCTLLGRLAGDMALTLSAHGGVYLSGSLVRRMGASRISPPFIRGFTEKGKMSDKVGRIPVQLLQAEHPCLLGASCWLESHVKQENH